MNKSLLEGLCELENDIKKYEEELQEIDELIKAKRESLESIKDKPNQNEYTNIILKTMPYFTTLNFNNGRSNAL
jgi:predicted  nucleic acid-binding Zn-ribbon protein